MHCLLLIISYTFFLQNCLDTTSVSSVTKNTPARFSRLKYEDEIITYAFVKNDVLEIGTEKLTTVDLDMAAVARKTLVLVVKRPVKI